jgi:hypothetical protein
MITDVVGFGAVSTKLMDVVSNGIGSLWEPHKTKGILMIFSNCDIRHDSNFRL